MLIRKDWVIIFETIQDPKELNPGQIQGTKMKRLVQNEN